MPAFPRIRRAFIGVGLLAVLGVATLLVADAIAGKRPAPAFKVRGKTVPALKNVYPGRTWTTTVTLVVGKKRVLPALTVKAVKERKRRGGVSVLGQLRVVITDLKSKKVVYRGKLVGMKRRALGKRLPARKARKFRLVISLPNTGVPDPAGTGDDRYQGSSGRIVWSWTAR
jgi:hypothetical protein